ncbi:CLUMA_CG008662, isoform A, partial [Clunio marinus]
IISVLLVNICCASRRPKPHKRTQVEIEEHQFKAWSKKFGKKYLNDEEKQAAMKKFLENKVEIDKHNGEAKEGRKTYKLKTWENSDLTNEEKKQHLLGIKEPPEARSAPVPRNLPQFQTGGDYVNWVEKGLVGPVMTQAWCGSCWAFSALGVVEGVLRRKNITDEPVSPQQLVDCSKRHTYGCCCGWPKYAIDYVKENGVSSDFEYPYIAEDDVCTYHKEMSVATTHPFIDQVFLVPTRGNETWLRDIVATVGPVSAVMCMEKSFFDYSSGVYYEPECCTDLEHGVLIVGYGTDPGKF